MSPKKRDRQNEGLPPHLYPLRRGDKVYWRYRNPQKKNGDPGLWTYFPAGTTRAQAIEAAKELNAALSPTRDLAARVLGGQVEDVTLRTYADRYLNTVLPMRRINGHPLSVRYIEETTRILNACVVGIGASRMMSQITQAEIAEYLNGMPSAGVHEQHRTRLVQLWKRAMSDGIVTENPPARILPWDKAPKKRKRITLPGDRPGVYGIDGIEAYKKIWDKAERAVQCAMELELNILQRREEVHRWRFDWSHEDRDGKHVYIRISKTHKRGVESYIRIPESLSLVYSAFGAETLGDLLRICRSDGIPCPFVVHRRPEKAKKSKDREHPFQLTPAQITRGFAEARDATGIYEHLEPGEKPSFHELIALGEHLRKKKGWTDEQIQALRGHREIKTTRIYLEGHEWTTIVEPPKQASR